MNYRRTKTSKNEVSHQFFILLETIVGIIERLFRLPDEKAYLLSRRLPVDDTQQFLNSFPPHPHAVNPEISELVRPILYFNFIG